MACKIHSACIPANKFHSCLGSVCYDCNGLSVACFGNGSSVYRCGAVHYLYGIFLFIRNDLYGVNEAVVLNVLKSILVIGIPEIFLVLILCFGTCADEYILGHDLTVERKLVSSGRKRTDL